MAMPPGLPAQALKTEDLGPKKPLSRSKSFAEVKNAVNQAPTKEEIIAEAEGMNTEELQEKVQAL